jgi:signal transduction histidine kinase
VPRSLRWSARSSGPRFWPLWLAGAALGIAAEWSLYGWSHPGDWLPDLLTGWCLIGCGLVGWSRRPESWSGALLAATGFAWFAPNFATSGVGGLDWLGAHALYWHRAPLAALVLTYPSGRPAGRFEAGVVAALCVIALIVPVWRDEVTAIVLAAALLAVAARGYVRAAGRERRMRLLSLRATGLVSVTLAVTALIRVSVPGRAPTLATLHAYQVMLCVLSIGLLIGLLRAPWERSEVTDLVVELGEARSATLRDALAQALGDPSLELGFWFPAAAAYVDGDGRRLQLPAPGSTRSATRVDRDGQPMAILVHDPSVLGDQGLVDGVASAAKLAAANVRLREDVRARIAELAESRRRIIAASDEERDRLERRLRDGAQRRLAQLRRTLSDARQVAASAATAERIAHAQAQLSRTQQELRRLARGIHPRELSEHGLASALAAIAVDFPVPVELSVLVKDAPAAVESCAYFVCSEALANVAKYASASRVRVSVTARAGGTTAVEIEDDGIGGADLERGTGLRGLADRVDALGGRLTVLSPPGRGTRLSALISLHGGPAETVTDDASTGRERE